MIRNKKAKVITMVFVILFLLAGCWDYREIEDVVITAGFAVDIGSENTYLLTMETIGLEQSSGGDIQPQSKVIKVEGLNLFDAVRNAIKVSPHRLYWSHTKVIIISEEVAREGIVKVLDVIIRAPEPRLTMNILISKKQNASELLPYDTLLDKIYSYEIAEMLKAQEDLSKAPNNEVREVVDKLMAEGISAVIPTIGLTIVDGVKTPKISGLAMFKKDSLVGFLDEAEVKTFLFITNQIKGGVLIDTYPPEDPRAHIAFNIFENKTKIQPKYEEGKVVMQVKTNTKGAIQEWEAKEGISEEILNYVKKQFEETLRKDIEKLVKKVQKEYRCDIFGFGQILMNENPKLWRELKEDWENVFANIEIEVNTNIDIRNTDFSANSIRVGD